MPIDYIDTISYQRMAPTIAVLRGPNQWSTHNTAECTVLFDNTVLSTSNYGCIITGQESCRVTIQFYCEPERTYWFMLQ